MTHATDGLLQAYLDGEIDSQATAALIDHLAGCASCTAELNALRRVGVSAHEAIGLLTVTPPMLRARAALGSERRTANRRFANIGARGLAKAAMLLLALAGAGAAAIPGSPVRRALESTIARVAQFLGAEEQQIADQPFDVPAEETAAVMVTDAAVLPANGRVRVVLHTPAAGVDVTVRLVDAARAKVETAVEQPGVRYRTGAGRIEVTGLSAGAVTIDIPVTVPSATIEIDGQVHTYKQGGVLHLSGPAGTDRGTEVRFRIGT
ncbi:hypothetical protein BH23GEM9_BH23GEM9_21090 [soil metagenome]